MTESCLGCGKPLTEGERAAGLLCTDCAAIPSGEASTPGRGLRPGSDWNAARRGAPIGAIGRGTQPPGSGSSEDRREDRIDGEGNGGSGGPETRDDSHAGASEEPESAGHHGYDEPPVEQPAPEPYDPDRPPWGVGMAIVVWVASVASIILIPLAGVIAWLVVRAITGHPLGGRAQLQSLLESPRAALIGVAWTIVAHLVTLAIIWAVVTGAGRRPVLEVLGWRWTGLSRAGKVWFVIGVVVMMYAAEFLLGAILPDSKETDFERLLKASASVRIVIAFLAVFTAPLVEECVYRGVLYSGLRRALGVWPSIIIVTAVFAGVHLQQYWGAWAGVAGIAVLSFTLTLIRAKTKSLLPCIAVHLVFNAVSSLIILFHHY